MRRAFLIVVASLLLLSVTACDAAFLFSTGNIDGTVSQVRFTFLSDGNGTSWQVTIITLQTLTGPSQLTACGNQVNRFPMDSTVNVKFTPGTPCASNIVVTLQS
jgi:uncharacterized lipoprotein YehR (DUF1307 family)